MNCKTGRNVGMGQINKKNHIQSKGREENEEEVAEINEENDSE